MKLCICQTQFLPAVLKDRPKLVAILCNYLWVDGVAPSLTAEKGILNIHTSWCGLTDEEKYFCEAGGLISGCVVRSYSLPTPQPYQAMLYEVKELIIIKMSVLLCFNF
jgi:hypothetical protein